MSVSQVQGILGRALPTQSGPRQSRDMSLYFTYGSHLSFSEFKDKYPGAQVLGIGFLDNWTWHINSLGEPNVRPSPITQTDIMIKGPVAFPMSGNGTFEWQNAGSFGSIFLISPEIEDSIDRECAASRVKICQGIKVVMSFPKIAPVIRMLDCIFHYDARNTSDGCRDLWKTDVLEQKNWKNSLAGFRKSGVPDWYISRICKHLIGHNGDAEPFSMNMAEIKPGYVCRTPISVQKSYRIQKRAILQSRQNGSGHTANKCWAELRNEHCVRRVPKQEPTAHPRGRSASASCPIRRQEAILVRPPMFTWYPQVRSTSAAVPPRFQQVQRLSSSNSPNPHHGQHISASPTAMPS